MTTIKFRLDPKDLTPIAFIFDERYDNNMAYTTIGQHSSFSMEFYEECIIPTPPAIRVFAKELFRVGYEFSDIMAGIDELKQVIKDKFRDEYMKSRV